MITAGEQVWQKDSAGLTEQLAQAYTLETEGKLLEAYLLRTTAFYSHYASQLLHNPIRALYEFSQAKQYARATLGIIEKKGFDALSDGQCDVLATVLIRRWLWVRPTKNDLFYAPILWEFGQRKNPLPHSAALMHLGMAETYYLEREFDACKEEIAAALHLQTRVQAEINRTLAYRQFSRVLRRAALLSYKLGDHDHATELIAEARRFALHYAHGSRDQLYKINAEWKRRTLPPFLQLLLPH